MLCEESHLIHNLNGHLLTCFPVATCTHTRWVKHSTDRHPTDHQLINIPPYNRKPGGNSSIKKSPHGKKKNPTKKCFTNITFNKTKSQLCRYLKTSITKKVLRYLVRKHVMATTTYFTSVFHCQGLGHRSNVSPYLDRMQQFHGVHSP